jgi:hypothetical protein
VKVEKWVEFAKVVEIEIGREDIAAALAASCSDALEPQSCLQTVLRALNTCAAFLGAIPEATICEMTPSQREITARFLHKQASRFEFPPAREDSVKSLLGLPPNTKIGADQ